LPRLALPRLASPLLPCDLRNVNTFIVLTMIGVSNSNRTSNRNGVQPRTDAYI
jgi:hypothetical protein